VESSIQMRQTEFMFLKVFLVVVATFLVTVPQWFSTLSVCKHANRLAELRHGAAEKYFEERRALETSPPVRRIWPYRLFGLITMAYAIGRLMIAC
jgi:hypothetical protein